MTRAIIIAGFILSLAGLGAAQTVTPVPIGSTAERQVSATTHVTDFRPVGETRLWTFFARQQRIPFGQFISVVKEQTEIDGRTAVVLTQKLDIDYNKIGTDRKVAVAGETRLTREGVYLGTTHKIGAGDSAERLELKYSDNRVRGYYTRGGNEVRVDVPLDRELPAWDPNFLDELEICLARQNLSVGDSVIGSVYSPQTMLTSQLRGYVKSFMRREIYQGKFDSVYVIDIAEPQVYEAFFTPDKRLVRLDLADENIRIYQDLVRKAGPEAAKTITEAKTTETVRTAKTAAAPQEPPSSFSPRLILFRLPYYIAYLVIGLGTILFLSRVGFKWLDSYVALAAGAVAFALIIVTQIPLQTWLVTAFVAPHAGAGGSLYVWGLLPPLVAGVAQELIKWGVLAVILFWRRTKDYRYATLGAFLGAGFGIVESGYVLGASVMTLFDWPLLERAFVLVFHVAAGAILGQAIAKGRSALTLIVPLLILVNGIIRYLPVFVQQGDIDLGLMHFVLAFLSLGFLFLSLTMLRRAPRRSRDTGEPAQTGL